MLVYEAPPACPNGDAFYAEVAERTPHANEDGRTLYVRITANDEGGFSGHLHFEENGAETSARAVEAASCAEVVDALALVAALAVDTHVSEAPKPVEPPAQPPPAVVVPDRVVIAPKPRETHLRVGAQAVETALPTGVFSARAFAEIVFRDPSNPVAPSLRVGFSRSASTDRVPSTGRASLTWTTGSIEGCPLRVALGAGFTLRPCVEAVVGVLEGAGSDVPSARDRSRPWAEVDAHARLGWDVTSWLAVEAEGGPTVPLVREQFVFNPGVDVYQAPIIALFGRAGVAVRFW